MTQLTLPYKFEPRDYQRPVFEAFDSGFKRLLLIWHRRAGKDKTCMNLLARSMLERVGTYFYFLPSFAQGKRVIWNGMDGAGFRFISHIPRELWEGKPNETEMRIRLKNGSVFQVVGSDNIDNVVGTNPIGCVFSEYSLEDPNGWDFIRPILRENGGWAIFNGTPRGKANHLFKMYEMARLNKEWWVQKCSATDTGVLTDEDIQAERDSGMDEEMIQQEYFCSFEGGMSGAWYINHMQEMQAEGRITSVPYDSALKVHTAWDLGVDDATAVVFFQQTVAGQIRIIDYFEESGEGLPYYVRMLQDRANEHGYIYGEHIGPWDLAVREMGTGKSRLEAARELGVSFKVARKLSFHDGVNAVRMALPMCLIDENKCSRLIEALMSYTKIWDKQMRKWTDRPRRDWATHGADAVRYMAVGRRNARLPKRRDRYSQVYGRERSHSWMAA